jgi:tetratricopeptide (TPR) repeat protein
MQCLRLIALAAVLFQHLPASATPTAVNNSRLDAPLFYQLLLGEISFREGDPGAGFSFVLDAARRANDETLYKRAADMALQARSGEPALQAARAWRQAFPASREANRYVLQILIGMNKLGEVLEPLKREITLSEPAERREVISGLPRYFARNNDKRAALGLVEQALQDHLKNPATGAAAWATLGRMRLGLGDAEGALASAKRGQALDPKATEPIMLALALMMAKEPQAEPLVKEYLQKNSKSELQLDYVRVLIDAQRYAQAAELSKRITTEQPGLEQAWLIQGVLALQDKKLDLAQSSLERYLALMAKKPQDPQSATQERGLVQAYLSLAQIAEQRKDLAGAEAWLAKVDNPEDLVRTQSRRASLLAQQGRLDEARALIKNLPERSPEDARAKLNAEVTLLREAKQYQAAYDMLSSWTESNPADADLLYDQAMMADKLKLADEMERLLRLIIRIQPDFHHAYNALGYALAERNVRLDEARELVEKALSLAPGDPYITDSLGWVEFRAGNKTAAEKILQTAYKTKADAEIAAHLGEVLWSLGKREQALKIWREGLQLSPDNETLRETLQRLRVKP